MQSKILFTIIFVALSINAFSQKIEDYFDNFQYYPIQKLYLHTDREFYFLGDTLWFAAYLVDAQYHIPVQGNSNLHVELVNSEGQVALHKIFPILNGLGQGYLSIEKNNLKNGTYLIRSYNKYLLNFGESLIFKKRIRIGATKSSFELPGPLETETADINIDFFPEGGFLLAERINTIAFKATDSHGRAKDISGKILDENGNLICLFATFYKGIGKFLMVPEFNLNYIVKIDGIFGKVWKLPMVRKEGAKIRVTKMDTDFVNLNINISDNFVEKSLYLAIIYRGAGVVYLFIERENINKTIKLNSYFFRNGINRLILLNQKLEPLSERLVFMNKSESVKLNLELNDNKFVTREKVDVQISGNQTLKTHEDAALSMVAVNSNALNAKGLTQNIKSYLLVDSELKGQIDDVADYFLDDDKLTSAVKLDLLMLVQGWRNYFWNELENMKVESENPEFGFSFRGKLLNRSKKKIIANSEVTLGLDAGPQSQLLFTNTDEKGNFAFENIIFYDSAMCILQGKNNKEKLSTSIELEPVTANLSEINYSELNDLKYFKEIPHSLYKLNYLNELSLKEFYPDRNSKLIEEIKVRGKKPEEDDGHFRLYSMPSSSNSLKIKDTDFSYASVFQYLQGRVAGVRVIDENIIIRGQSSLYGSNEPLYLFDGIPVDNEMIGSISMTEIDKIEILKGTNAAIFGARGSNGVISVLSRTGDSYIPVAKEIPGTLVDRIEGFAKYCKFYSPQYSSDNLFTELPDYRTTLYWNPEIILVDGNAEVSFFTCDNLSEYSIFVEGISSNGRTCLGSTNFEVDKRAPSSAD